MRLAAALVTPTTQAAMYAVAFSRKAIDLVASPACSLYARVRLSPAPFATRVPAAAGLRVGKYLWAAEPGAPPTAADLTNYRHEPRNVADV